MQMSAAHARCMDHRQLSRDSLDDMLTPARGIVIGCAISAGLWMGLIALAIS